MTPDIQELKKRALAAKEAGLTHPASLKELHALNAMGAIASPDTILALIEIAEAADRLERNVGVLSIAEVEIRQAISNTNWQVIQHWREQVRTALEGVKK